MALIRFEIARRGPYAGGRTFGDAGSFEQVDGVDCKILVARIADVSTRFWVDGEGRILKQAYQGTHPFTQAPGEFEVYFSDYREMAGRLIPFVRTTLIDGSEFAVSTAGSIEVDPEFDEAIFEKPAA